MVKQLQTVPKVMKVQLHQIEQAVDFAMRVRREVFPMMNHEQIPVDLMQFREHYMETAGAVFLVAVTEEASVVGSVGIVPYDGRIQLIEGRYPEQSAAEIVKCYVDPAYRRYGIGSLLVKELERVVREMPYTTLYLHTHRFLPGAVDFWQRQGFTLVTEEHNEWQIVHMDKQAEK